MKERRICAGLMVALCLLPVTLSARDMVERPSAVTLTFSPDSNRLFSSVYGEMSYVNHHIKAGRYDTFQLRNFIHAALVDGWRQRIALYYGTYLFVGPVDDPSAIGSDLAPWLMNAVQFEYGVSWHLSGRYVDFFADYGRRSYHPLRREFAEPAADILRGGIGLTDRCLAGGRFDGLLRLRWSRLFEFWGSDIPNSRATWALQPAVEYRRTLVAGPGASASAFGMVSGDLLFLDAGGMDLDLAAEIGLALGTGRRFSRSIEEGGALELYIDFFRSGDTEERVNERSDVLLVGTGIRYVFRH